MKKITIIHFKQQGQDFSRWEVDSNGKVIASHPCQGWMWGGCQILNFAELKVGGFVVIHKDTVLPREIKYPLTKIETRKAKFAIQRNGPGKDKDGNRTVTYRTNNGHSKYFNKARVFQTYTAAFQIYRHLPANTEIIEL